MEHEPKKCTKVQFIDLFFQIFACFTKSVILKAFWNSSNIVDPMKRLIKFKICKVLPLSQILCILMAFNLYETKNLFFQRLIFASERIQVFGYRRTKKILILRQQTKKNSTIWAHFFRLSWYSLLATLNRTLERLLNRSLFNCH